LQHSHILVFLFIIYFVSALFTKIVLVLFLLALVNNNIGQT